MRKQRKERSTRLMIVTLAVCTTITFPMMLIPVGLRQGTPNGILVARAYEETYPDDEQEEILIEDWAINRENLSYMGEFQKEDDGSAHLGENQMVDSYYFEGEWREDSKYDSILTAQIEQTYDSSDLPIELLDTSTFTPVNEQLYISTSETILKQEPNMDSVTVGRVDRSSKVTRRAVGSTWSLVETVNGEKGYILNKSLSKDMVFNSIDRTVWVDASGLKLRSRPSTDSDIVKVLARYTRLHCTGIANDQWYRVELDDGTKGYVYVSYTRNNPPPTPTPKPTPRPTPTPKKSNSGGGNGGGKDNNGGGKGKDGGNGGGNGGDNGGGQKDPPITGVNGESVVIIAKSMLGVPYYYTGESRNGIDCSGLVVYCYRQLGIPVTHQSNSIRFEGSEVKREDIRLGDVLVYDLQTPFGEADHVAIYAGNGQVIHASSRKGKVVWGNMDMGSIMTIRRFIK